MEGERETRIDGKGEIRADYGVIRSYGRTRDTERAILSLRMEGILCRIMDSGCARHRPG